MREIFVDTSAWVGVLSQRDKFHTQASRRYKRLLEDYTHLVTTNLVIAETFSLVRNTIGLEPSLTFMQTVQNSSRLIQIYSEPALDSAALAIIRKYSDQHFSLVDAVSFALMQQREIQDTFSYDFHFAVMGFNLIN